MSLSRGNGAARLPPNMYLCLDRHWRLPDRTLSAGLFLLLLLLALADLVQAQPSGSRILLDDDRYARVPLAARLMRQDYANLPPRHSAKRLQVQDVKRLFELDEADKVRLVKKSIAEEKPVVITLHTPPSFHSAKAVWNPPPHDYAQQDTWCRHNPCQHQTVTVVAYDDARYGGAFEIMLNQGARRDRNDFLWVRYKDFQHFCKYAFELIEQGLSSNAVVPFAGAVHFEHASGAMMPAQRWGRVYKLQRPYPSGTQFRVVISATGPAYVYAFSSDLTRKTYRLLPAAAHHSAHLGYRQNHIVLPDEMHYLQLDAIPGTDYFCVLYAKQKLDLAALMRQIQMARGEFPDRLYAVLGTNVVAAADIQESASDEIKFTARGQRRRIVPIVVEIQHVKGE